MVQDRLKTYRGKRDFTRTAEPSGRKRKAAGKRSGGGRYLIQKHAARALHYDFRLEHDGALMSWAIPKGPSFNPQDKRLAVHVEDHPLAYGNFEGTIPKGEYGGGTVMLWDRGTWKPMDDVDDGLSKGNLKFELKGKRLRGGFALIRLRGRSKKYGGGRDNWLLIKERDAYAKSAGKQPTEQNVRSVKTGRTMDEISRGNRVWQSKPKTARKAPGKTVKKIVKKAARKTARRARR